MSPPESHADNKLNDDKNSNMVDSDSERKHQHQAQQEKQSAPSQMNQNQKQGQNVNPETTTPTSTPSSSIEISTRSDISLLYRLIRTLIRPIRPNLVRPGKPFPAGSPRLSPPKKRDVDIVESCSEGVWQYTLRPKNSSSSASASTSKEAGSPSSSPGTSSERDHPHGPHQRRHRIYYFNGGGFQSPPSSQHWLFLTNLAKKLSLDPSASHNPHHHQQPPPQKYTPEITLVSYPLAPNSPASKSFPILEKWLSAILESADASRDKITLMGDSSGGNIALSLGFWAVENHIPRQSQPDPQGRADAIPGDDTRTGFPLASIIAISPAVDLRNVNPAMHDADKFDPVLTVGLTSRVARAWASDPADSRHLLDMPDGPRPHLVTDAQLSPLLNSDEAFGALRKKGVGVHGVVGTHDVLAPDALLFMRKCERCGVRGKWLVWENLMHCFPLAAGKGGLGLSEAKVALGWIVDVVRGHDFQKGEDEEDMGEKKEEKDKGKSDVGLD